MSEFKSSGTTDSERVLARLCEKTFLSFWSYPNVFRDQGQPGGDGKEICDLLVVCGKDVVIFSDKSCVMPNTGDLNKDWGRWFKRAIEKSADQVHGAERWLRCFPDRVFLDRKCSKKLPLSLQTDVRFHRVVVALGAKARCSKELGGSGSLLLFPAISADEHADPSSPNFRPFAVGTVTPGKGFVHVLDDVTLEIMLRELNTATDFLTYLRKKEEFIQAGKLFGTLGEENLLARIC